MAEGIPSDVLGRIPGAAAAIRNRRNKYGVAPSEERRHPVTLKLYASKAELHRALELEILERAGEITHLRQQVSYPLNVPMHEQVVGTHRSLVPGGRVGTYVADFVYRDKKGREIVEDVKGVPTPEYELKKRLMKALLGIEIVEIRRPASPHLPRSAQGPRRRRTRSG